MKPSIKSSGLVYSTDQGRMCPGCRNPLAKCSCKKTVPLANGDGVVRISRQTKGRKGAGVTLISGVPLSGNDLEALVKTLKQKRGVGGAIKDGIIEIQGDQRDFLKAELDKLGWIVKISGG